MTNRQRGVSFSGFLVAVIILILISIAGMKIAPVYIQGKSIKNLFDTIVHDPEMQNASVHEIKASFSKRASVADITVIKAEDIEVAKGSGGIALSANYSVKIPLIGNASLLLEFNPSSSK